MSSVLPNIPPLPSTTTFAVSHQHLPQHHHHRDQEDHYCNEYHFIHDNQQPQSPFHHPDLVAGRANHEQEPNQAQEQHNKTFDTLDPHREDLARPQLQLRKGSQSQLSDVARSALFGSMSLHTTTSNDMPITATPAPHPIANLDGTMDEQLKVVGKAPASLAASDRPSSLRHRHTEERVGFANDVEDGVKPRPMASGGIDGKPVTSPTAFNDTPATTAPSSPSMLPRRQNSNEFKVRAKHPTTLDIPGLTKSAVSPDGRIAQRDLGSKLVIVMVGLPARGKSYITKKLARYLNWLQHDTRIFNVGDRRRVAASGHRASHSTHGRGSSAGSAREVFRHNLTNGESNGMKEMDPSAVAAHILLNGGSAVENTPEVTKKDGIAAGSIPELVLPEANHTANGTEQEEEQDSFDQSASFFDPGNKKAADLREQVALESLDDLLDFIMYGNGSIGILDATNSTLERRAAVMRKIRSRAGPDLNVLFIESICVDENLLERNIRLKLSGPDYRDKDPEASLADFRARIALYEKSYVALGEFEEKNNMPYVQMIDVGRKIISHKIDGFLSAQAVYYLLNFNLTPRQIWITRHGESEDNQSGRLGGDSELTPLGHEYAQALTTFLTRQRKEWEIHELDRHRQSHFPPTAGDLTPPNPHCEDESEILDKNFCVWTSMLKRSIQTAEYFDESEYDVKQMRMLNEIYAGKYEGFTYEEIKQTDRDTFEERKKDKLHYRYPGPGGEGYLDVINRLRPVILELERMHDHCILIGHRSVARILLAYFKGLPRDEVTELDVPIGMLYCLEPRPYGVDFKAFLYSHEKKDFEQVPEHQLLKRANSTFYEW